MPFLRFLNAPAPGQPLTQPPRLSVSVAGGRPVAMVMDTGSTGVLVAADRIPNWQGLRQLGPARLTYSSSGRVMEGWWVEAPLEIAGHDDNTVRTVPMPVMAVTRISCLHTARNCREEVRPRNVAMIGVGFARQGDHQAQSTPDHNPFLRLETAMLGKAHRGYVIMRTGVTPGVESIRSAYHTVSLSRSPTFDDWAATPACFAVADRIPAACGSVLVDTGVVRAFLTVPSALLAGHMQETGHGTVLRAGTPVTVHFGGDVAGDSAVGYTFRAQDWADPVAPRDVTLVRRNPSPAFLNTSVHFLNGFDYLFDADRGLVGFRASPLGDQPTP